MDLVDENSQPFGVVEESLEVLELLGAESACDGLARYLSCPKGVGTVQLGWLGPTAAVRLTAAIGLEAEGSGQRETRLGQLPGDPAMLVGLAPCESHSHHSSTGVHLRRVIWMYDTIR